MEIKIINGQPQISSTFGNRMVTYDGLVDFLKMLKDEIPRMGHNNKINGGYSFAFGSSNTGTGPYTFIHGKENAVESSIVFGHQNEAQKIHEEKQAYIFGSNNNISQIGAVYILGNNCHFNSINQTNGPLYCFGQYNLSNIDYSRTAIVVGNGTAEAQRKNLLTLDYDGGLSIENGYFKTPVVFNKTLTLCEELEFGTYRVRSYDDRSQKLDKNNTKYTIVTDLPYGYYTIDFVWQPIVSTTGESFTENIKINESMWLMPGMSITKETQNARLTFTALTLNDNDEHSIEINFEFIGSNAINTGLNSSNYRGYITPYCIFKLNKAKEAS